MTNFTINNPLSLNLGEGKQEFISIELIEPLVELINTNKPLPPRYAKSTFTDYISYKEAFNQWKKINNLKKQLLG